MKKLIIVFVVMFLCSGCIKTKWSEPKEEGAEVIQLSYVPSQNYSGNSVGFDVSGKGGVIVSGTSGQTREVWATVFRCDKHFKTFALEGKQIYENAKVGQRVKLVYRELLQYDNKEPNNTTVVDYKTEKVFW